LARRGEDKPPEIVNPLEISVSRLTRRQQRLCWRGSLPSSQVQEFFMPDFTCPKCQGNESVPDVKIIDHAHLNQPLDLSATIYLKPDAMIFKTPISRPLEARVCAACGYTEFYVDNPQALLEWSRKAKSQS
jgi:predicted nucleic-acid-binding Zn-ribbon protein